MCTKVNICEVLPELVLQLVIEKVVFKSVVVAYVWMCASVSVVFISFAGI